MSASLAAAAAAALRRRASHPLTSLLSTAIARDGGATASASGRGVSSLSMASTSTSTSMASSSSYFQRQSLLFSSSSSLADVSRGSVTAASLLPRATMIQISTFSSSNSASSSSTSTSTSSSTSSTSQSPPETSASFVRLNNIFPSPGSKSQARRVGRGIGSGRGKTSTRGHKGQKARSGATPTLGFEGGQTPLSKRLPRRGFRNAAAGGALDWTPLNVGTIQRALESGKLSLGDDPSSGGGGGGGGGDGGRVLTMRELAPLAGLRANGATAGIKLLAKGKKLSFPVRLEVSAVSERARKVVEDAGGSVSTVYFNALGLRALLRPRGTAISTRSRPPGPANPPPKKASRFEKIGVVPEYAEYCKAAVSAAEKTKEGNKVSA